MLETETLNYERTTMKTTPSDVKKQPQDVVHNITDSGEPIAKRVSMPAQAVSIYDRFKQADSESATHRTKVQGQMNGNRPYNPSLLKHKGQGWRANFNSGEAEAIRDTNAESYWSLLMDSPGLITCKVRRDPNDSYDLNYGEVIAEEYSDLLTEWPDFFYNVLLHSIELFTFGTGPMVWVDQFDWRPRAYKAGNVLLSPKLTSAVGDIEIMFLRDTLSASEMVKKLEAGDVSTKVGYNLPAIRDLMKKTYLTQEYLSDDDFQRSPVESVLQAAKNHDSMLPFWDVEPIKVVHLFVKQVKSQKVSHFIFRDGTDVKEYILEANDVIEDMQNVLCMFTSSIGDGYLKSIRGLGQKMFPHIEVSNRLICSTIDTARISGSLVLTGGSTSDNTLVVSGPVVRLPQGAAPVQTSYTPKLDQMIMVRTMLQQILNNTHGVYKKAVEYPGMPDRTALEVRVEAENQARFTNFAIVLYYTHWDRCHREIFRRLVNKDYPAGHAGHDLAKTFRDRCKDRGVPEQYLDIKKCRIRSMRAIGAGSPAIRKIVSKEVLDASAMFRSERGRVNALREYLAARVGYDNVDRFEPIMTPEESFTSEHTIALLESHDMAEGVAVPVAVDQPHMIHAQVHIQPLMEIAAGLMKAMEGGQQINPQAVLPYFEVALPHLETTLQMGSRDPRNKMKVKTFMGQFKQLVVVFKNLQSLNEQQQQEQAQAQEQQLAEMQAQQQANPNPELQIKIEKMRGELAIKTETAQKNAQIKEWKTRHDAALKEFKAKNEMMMEQAMNPAQPQGVMQ